MIFKGLINFLYVKPVMSQHTSNGIVQKFHKIYIFHENASSL